MKKIIFILMLVYLGSLWSSDILIVRIDNPDQAFYQAIQTHELTISYKDRDGSLEVLIPENKTYLLDQNRYNFRIENSLSGIQRDIAGYHSYAEVTTELQRIATDYPDFTSLFSLGKSSAHLYYLEGKENYEGYQHEIWCLKLSDNPELEEDEPNVYFAGEIHARETISLEVDLYLLNYLVEKYGVDQEVTAWINNRQIWFVPLINPDGYKLVYEGNHLMHRKNMRDNDGDEVPDASTTDGVDLNRNFGYVWGSNGTSDYSGSNIYHGPEAWSEVEATYLRDLIQGRKFYAGITYHSQGEYVLYPLGHLPGACAFDHEIMHDLASNMAATIPGIYSGTYTPLQAVDFGYTCQGTMGDWSYAEERVFGYTVELARTYIPPQYQIEQICEDNLQAALMLIDRVDSSMVTGNITDGLGNPLLGEVYVLQVDNEPGMTEVEPFRSDEMFGRYYRLLLPGTYTLKYVVEGFEDITVENVVVTEDEVTTLDITFPSADFIPVSISNNSGIITLNWTAETGEFQVYSCSNSIGDYQLETGGSFISTNSWQISATSSQKFFKVRRVIR